MKFNKFNTEHFCVLFDDLDKEYAKIVSTQIEYYYDKAKTDFSLPNSQEKYDLFLCPNVDEYIRLTNKTADTYEDWMVGWADYKLKRICILSPRIAIGKTRDEMNGIIIHEIVHIVFDSLSFTDNVDLWLAEGIATLYANQIDLNYVDKSNYPKIKDLLGEDNFVDNGGYDYCGIYVWYFISRYGVQSFKNVYAGKESTDSYLYPTFEKEALENFEKR